MTSNEAEQAMTERRRVTWCEFNREYYIVEMSEDKQQVRLHYVGNCLRLDTKHYERTGEIRYVGRTGHCVPVDEVHASA